MAPTHLAGLSVRVRADRSDEGAHAADLPGAPPGTWPFAGIEFVDTFQKAVDPPAATRVAEGFVQRGIAAGWLTGEGHRYVVRPAGTAAAPHAPTPAAPGPHVFHHYDALVFHTTGGDVRYRVTHQPDKYADYAEATYPDRVPGFDGDDDTPVTDEVYAAGATRVDWFYDLALEG